MSVGPMPAKTLGLGLLVVGGVCLISGGLIAWGGVNRWLANGYLATAHDLMIAGNPSGARAEARSAVDLLPTSPSAVLAATDLSVSANAEPLLALRRTATPDERATLAAAAGLAQDRVPDGAETNPSDTALLKAIAERSPGPVTLSKDAPPHAAVLAAWATMRLAASCAAKRPDDAWQAASTLLTLAPRHAQAAELQVMIAGLAPGGVTKSALIAAVARISDPEHRARLGTTLLALRPERSELRMLIPGASDPAKDAANSLARTVSVAVAQPTTITANLVVRCLQAGQLDLAHELVAAAPTAQQPSLQTLIDLLDGTAFAGDQGRVSAFVVVAGQLSFHLSTLSGALPVGKVGIRIGVIDLPTTVIRRLGTLITVPLKLNGPQPVVVSYDGKPVFSTTVSL